ncbi:MAG TPA: nicotinate-nucleotide adenylyltransferase [Pyrinomonadaceae bacterium]|jgi:nicotinate-nucleotide adenylyltransferase
MKRIAFYGGSFDPLHCGHLTIARALIEQFRLDRFVFVPAFHAPHKLKRPTAALHRYAMLAVATNDEPLIEISKMEIDAPERPFTFETLTRLKTELDDTRIFFVMGADSWAEITTWREWEKVLSLTETIVVTRPDYEIGFDHVGAQFQSRIVDLRTEPRKTHDDLRSETGDSRIYITNAVFLDISATEIRRKIKENIADWRADVPPTVAKYVEKYELYR